MAPWCHRAWPCDIAPEAPQAVCSGRVASSEGHFGWPGGCPQCPHVPVPFQVWGEGKSVMPKWTCPHLLPSCSCLLPWRLPQLLRLSSQPP